MQSLESEEKIKNENPLKKWVIILGVIAFLGICSTVYLAFFAKPVYNAEFIKAEYEKQTLNMELDSLMAAHEQIKAQYGELSEQLSEKDSIINANADEIKKLIASQADYRKIKKQLERLQKISQEYVAEMDRLYTENRELKEENTQVKESLSKSEQKNAEIQKNNEELNEKIQTASVIVAYNFASQVVYEKKNGVEVITDRASKAKRFKISCVLGENTLREAGAVNIYCRISLPGDGRVLCQGKGDAYSFMYNGEKLQYTMKSTVNYTGKSEKVNLVWNLKDDDKAVKGTYVAQVYSDEGFLGETMFTLK
ncbi:MAG: hypothetical protein J6W84_06530 [Bacteroidales bacterium]|nr:hypothetical protein [Bacteroidales bacterium]MBQ7489162.1 hypothetical protein [Bacteroidales bacterium]